MKFFVTISTLVALTAFSSAAVTNSDISTIDIVGNKFFYNDTGEQFFLKGIAYQRSRREGEDFDRSKEVPYIDSLANITTCLRDLPLLVELGVNVIRVYQIDPNADHDICMNALASKGIYVLADMAESEMSIVRNNPNWDTTLYTRYTSVVDALHKYNNLLGLIAGNEVTNTKYNTDASPFVRAAIRDVRKYIKNSGYRKIPLGYASNDDPEIRKSLSNYFVCEDPATRCSTADFFGLNTYEWCGYSTYATSGYRDLTIEYSKFPVPIFFSEFGCNAVSPRPFTEVEALYGSTMAKVWSGGIVYEYFQEVNNYGVVKENDDGSVAKLEDFEFLKQRYNSVIPQGITAAEESAREIPKLNCSGQNDIWKANTSLPLIPSSGKCDCIYESFKCTANPANLDNDLLKEICSNIDCSEISANGTTGVYGPYSDCSLQQKLSYVLNKQYIEGGNKTELCDYDGKALLDDSVKSNKTLTESCKVHITRLAEDGQKKWLEYNYFWSLLKNTYPQVQYPHLENRQVQQSPSNPKLLSPLANGTNGSIAKNDGGYTQTAKALSCLVPVGIAIGVLLCF
ncbi:hypothetical protein G9P44_002981 [Scheffersomyces stipitis]|nr:hypothetical protein G9P44_002981 [Scheffersomyces stipitis]